MEDILIDYIKREFLRDDASTELDAETDLLVSGLLDSLAVMRLVAFIESNKNITIAPQDVTIEHFATINDICSYVSNKSTSPS